jgi:GntR family transcriptional regulator, transcriptional repressor for pyruvate dehydrogenase complex
VRTPDPQVAATYAGLLLQVQGVRLQDVYAARTVIESPAVSVVAAERSSAGIDRLRANLTEFAELFERDGVEAEGLTELSADFHALLVELAGNQTLTLLSGMLRHIVDGANRTYVEAQGSEQARLKSFRATMKSHTRLVDLIEAGDATGADELWRRHLGEVDRLLGEGGPAAGTVLDLLA